MRSAGEETDRSTLMLTIIYRMLDHGYTDLSTFKEIHGDPGQSTRNAAADPLERADHLAVHGAAAEPGPVHAADDRSEEHTSELQSLRQIVCRLLLEKKKVR